MSAGRKTASVGLVAAIAVAAVAAFYAGGPGPGAPDAGAGTVAPGSDASAGARAEVPLPEAVAGTGRPAAARTRRTAPGRRPVAALDAGRGAISGLVLDPEGKPPVPGATVRARLETAREPAATTVTAEDGTYLLGRLEEGIYVVDAKGDGLRADPLAGVAVRAGEETSGVDFVLDRGERIFGLVLGDKDQPVEGATVSVRAVMRETRGPRATGGEAESSAKSRSDGTFEVAGLSPGKKAVVAQAPGYRRSEPVPVELKAGGGGASVPRIELRLERGAFLAGIVTLTGGAPVSGVKVEVRPARGGGGAGGPFGGGGGRADDVASALSGEDGRWRVEGLTGRRFNAIAYPGEPSLAPALNNNVEAGREDVNFVLEPGGSLAGLVISAGTKTPIEGAQLSLGDGPTRKGATTDADGRFEMGPLPQIDAPVKVTARGKSPVEVAVRLRRGERKEIVVEMPEGCGIDGRVFAIQTKQPLEGAVVRVLLDPRAGERGQEPGAEGERGERGRGGRRGGQGGGQGGGARRGGGPFGGGQGPGEEMIVEAMASGTDLGEWVGPEELEGLLSRNTTTDSKGRFSFNDLPIGDHRVYAAHSDHPGAFAAASLGKPGDRVEVEIGLTDGGGIAGTVVDDASKPRPDELVLAFSFMGKARSARTDDRGEYAIKGLAPGSYFVNLGIDFGALRGGGGRNIRQTLAAGFTAKTANVEAGRVARVDFGAEPKTAVAGRVVRAGAVVPNQFVQFFPQGGVQGLTGALTNEEGRFEVGVPAGKYLVRIDNVSENLEVPANVPRIEHEFQLPSGSLSGRALNAASNDALRARIRVYKAERAAAVETLAGALGSIAGETRAREDGTFNVGGLAPGLYTITAEADGFATSRKDAIEVPAMGEATGIEMACEPGGVIRGAVVNELGEPMPGAAIWIVDAEAKDLTMGDPPRTDEEGRFEIRRFAPGRYRVTVLSETHAPWRQYVDFAGGTTDLAVALVQGGTLEVVVSSQAGNPVPGAAVELRYPDGDRVITGFLDFIQPTFPTGPDGRFRKSRLPPGPLLGTARLEPPGQPVLEGTFEATIVDRAERYAATTLKPVAPPPPPPGG